VTQRRPARGRPPPARGAGPRRPQGAPPTSQRLRPAPARSRAAARPPRTPPPRSGRSRRRCARPRPPSRAAPCARCRPGPRRARRRRARAAPRRSPPSGAHARAARASHRKATGGVQRSRVADRSRAALPNPRAVRRPTAGRHVARHVAEPGCQSRWSQWGWVENPATTGMPSPSTSSASWCSSAPVMPGSIRINPSSPRTAMELVQTHSLCRTQTPSATSVSTGSSRPRAGCRLDGAPCLTTARVRSPSGTRRGGPRPPRRARSGHRPARRRRRGRAARGSPRRPGASWSGADARR
jgi:hypothetical protein